jgi:hypothetical protein
LTAWMAVTSTAMTSPHFGRWYYSAATPPDWRPAAGRTPTAPAISTIRSRTASGFSSCARWPAPVSHSIRARGASAAGSAAARRCAALRRRRCGLRATGRRAPIGRPRRAIAPLASLLPPGSDLARGARGDPRQQARRNRGEHEVDQFLRRLLVGVPIAGALPLRGIGGLAGRFALGLARRRRGHHSGAQRQHERGRQRDVLFFDFSAAAQGASGPRRSRRRQRRAKRIGAKLRRPADGAATISALGH